MRWESHDVGETPELVYQIQALCELLRRQREQQLKLLEDVRRVRELSEQARLARQKNKMAVAER